MGAESWGQTTTTKRRKVCEEDEALFCMPWPHFWANVYQVFGYMFLEHLKCEYYFFEGLSCSLGFNTQPAFYISYVRFIIIMLICSMQCPKTPFSKTTISNEGGQKRWPSAIWEVTKRVLFVKSIRCFFLALNPLYGIFHISISFKYTFTFLWAFHYWSELNLKTFTPNLTSFSVLKA